MRDPLTRTLFNFTIMSIRGLPENFKVPDEPTAVEGTTVKSREDPDARQKRISTKQELNRKLQEQKREQRRARKRERRKQRRKREQKIKNAKIQRKQINRKKKEKQRMRNLAEGGAVEQVTGFFQNNMMLIIIIGVLSLGSILIFNR